MRLGSLSKKSGGVAISTLGVILLVSRRVQLFSKSSETFSLSSRESLTLGTSADTPIGCNKVVREVPGAEVVAQNDGADEPVSIALGRGLSVRVEDLH